MIVDLPILSEKQETPQKMGAIWKRNWLLQITDKNNHHLIQFQPFYTK